MVLVLLSSVMLVYGQLFTLCVYCVCSVQSIWKNENIRSLIGYKLGTLLTDDVPKVIRHKWDWNKHIKRDFAFYDLDWKNHSDIEKCSRILDNPVPMNTTNRALHTCPPQLAIDISSMPHGGLGVWTRTHIPRMTVFGPFEGERVFNDSADHEYGWNLNVVNWRENESIIANDPATSNWMRYINSARSYAELNIKKYVDYSGNVYYIALEDIEPYTEILANYPHSLSLNYPELFWSGPYVDKLTYVSFDCSVCNSSYHCPLLAKEHIRNEHHPSQNNVDDLMLVRKPDNISDFVLESLIFGQKKNTSSIFSALNNEVGGLVNGEETATIGRRKRFAKGSKTGSAKGSKTVFAKGSKTEKTKVTKSQQSKAKIHKKNATKIGNSRIKTTDMMTSATSTDHYTTNAITTPCKTTTTEKIKHINLDFSSAHNLEEKIKQRLIEAGIDIYANMNNTDTTPAGNTAHQYQDFIENAIRSSSGGMGSGEFHDFMNKLKILKTHGTLNVSKDKEDEAIKHFTFDTSAPLVESGEDGTTVNISLTTIINTLGNLLNETTRRTSHTKDGKSFTTVMKISPSKKRTRKPTDPCTCPTYSDYRFVWHNISCSSTESEFKIDRPNNLIQIRPRYYNESSEPQYPEAKSSSSSSTEETTTTVITKTSKTKVTRKRTKTSTITIKHTRRKGKSTKNHTQSSKTSTKIIKTKSRLKRNKTIET